jgi:hypothetical protein
MAPLRHAEAVKLALLAQFGLQIFEHSHASRCAKSCYLKGARWRLPTQF